MRLLNEDLSNHLEIQESKKANIKSLESMLMREEDYQYFLDQVKK